MCLASSVTSKHHTYIPELVLALFLVCHTVYHSGPLQNHLPCVWERQPGLGSPAAPCPPPPNSSQVDSSLPRGVQQEKEAVSKL